MKARPDQLAAIEKASRRVQARTTHVLDELTTALDTFTMAQLADPDERLTALLKLYGKMAYLADRSRRLAAASA